MNVAALHRLLEASRSAPLNKTTKLFCFDGGTAATHGYTIGIGSSLPGSTDTEWATGALFVKVGTGLYKNAGSGWGNAPSWAAVTTA